MSINSQYTKNRNELIEEQLDEFGYHFCQKKGCGTSSAYKFEVHHIVFRSEKPNHPEIHSKVNLIIVCNKCHNISPNSFHNKKDERNYLVEERGLDKIFNISLI